MPKIFNEENKKAIQKELIECGFALLKQGGLHAVNIDVLTKNCFIAKGTFYNLFENKSDYLYHMMLFERARSKEMLHLYLNENGQLSTNNLKNYLFWLFDENPNIFSYLTKEEQTRLISTWPDKYLTNMNNDKETMHMLHALLECPRKNPSWELACNYMKLIAVSLTIKDIFISSHYEIMIWDIIDKITVLLCK